MILAITIFSFHHNNITRKHFPVLLLLHTHTHTNSTYKTGERGKIIVSLKYTLNSATTVSLVIVKANYV